jgi:hypothetical protein
MVKRVVDMDTTFTLALGRRRAFGDDQQGRNGSTLSKKNAERLEAARRSGETFDEVLTRILDEYEQRDDNGEKEECIYIS